MKIETHIYTNRIYLYGYKLTKEDEEVLSTFLQEPYDFGYKYSWLIDNGTIITLLRDNQPYFTDDDDNFNKDIFNSFYNKLINYLKKLDI